MASATGNNSGKPPQGSLPSSDGRAHKLSKNPHKSDISPDSEPKDRMEEVTLTSLIEGEVIPRLMMAHSSETAPAGPGAYDANSHIAPAEAARFATRPLTSDTDDLLKEVRQFIDRGVSPESIYLDLLTPSARRLGQMWESDACDFLDVTIGLWRLQEVMHEIGRQSPAATGLRRNPPSALFTPFPGETHSFGALMVEEIFARAGWRSEVLLEPQRRELLQIIADNAYDVVGLTVSCDCLSATLRDLIAAIRSVSKSPTTRVIIGGRLVNARPELVEQCGADGTAPDAISALSLAERMVMEAHKGASST